MICYFGIVFHSLNDPGRVGYSNVKSDENEESNDTFILGSGGLEVWDFSESFDKSKKIKMIDQGYDFSVALDNAGCLYTSNINNLSILVCSKAHNKLDKVEFLNKMNGM